MNANKLFFRSIRKNIRMYYLYFFSMIFSISLYYIFATLQQDPSIDQMSDMADGFNNAFQAAGILLIGIIIVFTIYANSIFLRRRSQEIGLYQMIGLPKSWIIRFLVLENVLLGFGSLILGMLVGAILSRFFLIILLNLIGIEDVVGLPFSMYATIQTVIVFTGLIVISIVQIIRMITNNKLVDLFSAENRKDSIEAPDTITSGLLGICSLGLIGSGYYLSTLMLENTDLLLLMILLVLLMTISGTYLLFRVTISWIFHLVRKRKNGHLGLENSLSIAPLMHRLKGNANSLTLITVLSAMTITMVSLSYSLYYSLEKDTRLAMPFDFVIENLEEETESFLMHLEDEEITFDYSQIEALRLKGRVSESTSLEEGEQAILLLPAEQMQKAGMDVNVPINGEAILYNSRAVIEGGEGDYPKSVEYSGTEDVETLLILESVLENLINVTFHGQQLLVSEEMLSIYNDVLDEEADLEHTFFDTITIEDPADLERASELYNELEADLLMTDYYTMYQNALQMNGLIIFVTAFLGLVFLLSTGSILYFKQMTEGEQERQYFKTLRQLGFSEPELMKGVIKKQLLVYLVPLTIGIIHATFALNVGSLMVISSMFIPSVIGMSVYATIYLLFAFLTVNYYRNLIRNVM
ncbi:ABC transporter permease [Salipaludibacillus agaradhaerens]|uniref:ABC transporter permease n=1 Tax=Salipaludibacillus agaradhaerens TaxID=76935 RepID=UPI002150B249|nr:ABC transporter permease [Salipaludibacillus agaradhaerens]MCR6106140.1 ABC transporter permease [Salipaludibacillus agaradhaerens]MCR6118173.1 ABC transporter permease [Salipaludibacillus agaradhaerens]